MAVIGPHVPGTSILPWRGVKRGAFSRIASPIVQGVFTIIGARDPCPVARGRSLRRVVRVGSRIPSNRRNLRMTPASRPHGRGGRPIGCKRWPKPAPRPSRESKQIRRESSGVTTIDSMREGRAEPGLQDPVLCKAGNCGARPSAAKLFPAPPIGVTTAFDHPARSTLWLNSYRFAFLSAAKGF